mmetsp:Transcript_20086/g.66430  ORF Transcript_20086/g.66430 Transcript_20086/m.66430 type:complete len:331 (+) Transcript_20086:3-995(+)
MQPRRAGRRRRRRRGSRRRWPRRGRRRSAPLSSRAPEQRAAPRRLPRRPQQPCHRRLRHYHRRPPHSTRQDCHCLTPSARLRRRPTRSPPRRPLPLSPLSTRRSRLVRRRLLRPTSARRKLRRQPRACHRLYRRPRPPSAAQPRTPSWQGGWSSKDPILEGSQGGTPCRRPPAPVPVPSRRRGYRRRHSGRGGLHLLPHSPRHRRSTRSGCHRRRHRPPPSAKRRRAAWRTAWVRRQAARSPSSPPPPGSAPACLRRAQARGIGSISSIWSEPRHMRPPALPRLFWRVARATIATEESASGLWRERKARAACGSCDLRATHPHRPPSRTV